MKNNISTSLAVDINVTKELLIQKHEIPNRSLNKSEFVWLSQVDVT